MNARTGFRSFCPRDIVVIVSSATVLRFCCTMSPNVSCMRLKTFLPLLSFVYSKNTTNQLSSQCHQSHHFPQYFHHSPIVRSIASLKCAIIGNEGRTQYIIITIPIQDIPNYSINVSQCSTTSNELLPDKRYFAVSKIITDIGKQIGGWIRDTQPHKTL